MKRNRDQIAELVEITRTSTVFCINHPLKLKTQIQNTVRFISGYLYGFSMFGYFIELLFSLSTFRYFACYITSNVTWNRTKNKLSWKYSDLLSTVVREVFYLCTSCSSTGPFSPGTAGDELIIILFDSGSLEPKVGSERVNKYSNIYNY